MSIPSPEKSIPIEDKQMRPDDYFEFISDESGDKRTEEKPKESPKDEEATPDGDEEVEDDKKKTRKKTGSDDEEEKDDEVEDELKALEEELEEPDKAKLEAAIPVSRREILKAYPDLFKKFPALEKSYWRDREFTKYFPNPEDGEKALQAVTTIENFERAIVDEGDLHSVLKMVKDNNPTTFARMVDGYLDALSTTDRSAFDHVVGNVTKHLIKAMWTEGKESGDDSLQEAAELLNFYAFGTKKYSPPTKLAKDEAPEDKNKTNESSHARELFKQTMENNIDEVNSRVNNLLKINIEGNIDPNKSMSDFVRKSAIREALEKVNDLLDRDTQFKNYVNRAWEQAAKANFSKASVQKVQDLYVAKAKSLLAPVVKSARAEALRGLKVEKREAEETETERKPERQKTGENTERRLSSNKNKAKEIPAGMSSLDYLMQD